MKKIIAVVLFLACPIAMAADKPQSHAKTTQAVEKSKPAPATPAKERKKTPQGGRMGQRGAHG